jgi:alkyldihydroxyacetonephosphate synthase
MAIDSPGVNIRRRKHWGWGYEDQQPALSEVRVLAAGLAEHVRSVLGDGALGAEALDRIEAPMALDALELAPPRIASPKELAGFCASDLHARASHALGKSYTDVVSGFRGRFAHPPDLVARPRDESELERVLEWCAGARVAAIPYGGGTSVVGGVTPRIAGHDGYNGAVSIDLSALGRVLEVDPVSRSALIQAGATGPALEAQLAEHGFTLRHFPQSFELSTLGGWIATRAAGHFATVLTHIEDFVESTRAISPAGVWESRRLPGSGAGVSPDRMLAGSEGILGVITQAWVRVQPRPVHRSSAGVRFERFLDGAQCVRALSQSGLDPANCRLIDAAEARMTMAGDGSTALLVLGFESADHTVDSAMARALQICEQHGGIVAEGDRARAGARAGGGARAGRGDKAGGDKAGGDAVGFWRRAFLGAPYMRDVFVAMGVLSETFETAITWERFPELHERVIGAVREAVDSLASPSARGAALVSCRFTHVYPDGPAPYFTVMAPARRGEEVEQWTAIKRAASDAVLACGGTITHHHAVGRDHRPWYDRQRPEPFAQALRAAKAAVDPGGIMNPGVLIDPLT